MLSQKIKSPAQLKKTLHRLAKTKKVVFTNGCFDILHPGHVLYLEKAKQLGHFLVVALNSDASVKRLKGPTRPVNPLKDRQTVLAALQSVDYVTFFSEDTPLNLICSLKPQVLVKGGDWDVAKIVGAREVKSWGGKIRSIGFIKGKSTTAVIERSKSS